jgi:hypothetical protein
MALNANPAANQTSGFHPHGHLPFWATRGGRGSSVRACACLTCDWAAAFQTSMGDLRIRTVRKAPWVRVLRREPWRLELLTARLARLVVRMATAMAETKQEGTWGSLRWSCDRVLSTLCTFTCETNLSEGLQQGSRMPPQRSLQLPDRVRTSGSDVLWTKQTQVRPSSAIDTSIAPQLHRS